MTSLRTLGSRFLALFRKRRLEEELDAELRFHLVMETEQNLRRGMSPEEARHAAVRSFGGVEQTKEAWRDRRGLPRVEEWLRDLRFAARTLAGSPGFAVFAVLSLALGIGANTAIFTVVRALVLRPLPYPEPGGLVKLWESLTWQGRSNAYGTVSVANLQDWREQNQVFEEVAAFRPEGANLTHGENTLRVVATYVEGGVFRIMGVKPLLGRTILPEESAAGRDRVAVLSHGLWERAFGADPDLVGEKIQINGAAHTVVGVMPWGFQFPPRTSTELWTPLVFSARLQAERGSHWLEVIARLKPGVSWRAAQRNMDEIAGRLARLYPDTNATRGVTVHPLHLETVRETAQILLVLSGAVGFILLLACANVAHLVLARATGRHRELAVRVALGAGRWRVVRLLLAESVVLAAAGGTAGFFAARWFLDALLALAREQMPEGIPVEADAAVLWFCVIASLFAATLAGLIPALRVSQIDLGAALKDAGGPAGTALRRNRSLLMVWEVALALVLAIGALLLIRSLRVLNRFDHGFQTERVLTMKLALPEIRYATPAEAIAFHEGLLEEVRAIPGVSSAGLINYLPIQSWRETRSFTIPGRETPPPGHEPAAGLRRVSAGYFEAMGIPLLAGRYLRRDDAAGRQPVALISRLTAERYFPGENPVGRSIRYGLKPGEGELTTIVGMVGDIRERGVYRPVPTVVYLPYGQADWPQKFMSLVLRASVEPGTLTSTLRQLVRKRDPEAAVFLVKTMEQVVSESVAGTRLLSRLLTIFSLLALALAAVGVYGVMSYLVTQRTHEIGVRMALGAGRREVVRMVLARGLRNAISGTALGLMWTGLMSVALRRFVIGIGAIDPWTYLSAVLGILALVVVASGWPAWRASRVDPLIALHNE